jgi:carboxyl-terminal processing protease
MKDLWGQAYPTFGFQLVAVNGKLYAFSVLEAGPAARAGLVAWDRIVAIDGIAAEQSPRLEWRSDDAYIADDRDPPVHYLKADEGDTILIKVERRRGRFLELKVAAENYSAFAAARASARVYKEDGRQIGYIHFWYVHISGVPELLAEKLKTDFSDCEALIIDLRGRGGSGPAIAKILDTLREASSSKPRPVVALVDRQSRSAKDVLAYELKKRGLARLVGEPTAGAVIPATFADVGYDTILMFPSFKLPRYTDLLELKPVEPDVAITRAGPLSGGDDPILKAGFAEALRLVRTSAKPASAN